MPLTPADVHNVAFTKPPIGKRGYNEDEVDQFLDLVEDTLAELQDENDELRGQAASGDSDAATAAPAAVAADADPQLAADLEAAQTMVAELEAELDKANQAAARELSGKIPNARLAIIPGAGHEVNIDQPAALGAELVHFFSGG